MSQTPSQKPVDHAERMARALVSLDGLSVGDAFGERFFLPPAVARTMVEERSVPRAPWAYTDDTEMALAIVQVLDEHGHVEQEVLARLFGIRYRNNKNRGYGGIVALSAGRESIPTAWLRAREPLAMRA